VPIGGQLSAFKVCKKEDSATNLKRKGKETSLIWYLLEEKGGLTVQSVERIHGATTKS